MSKEESGKKAVGKRNPLVELSTDDTREDMGFDDVGSDEDGREGTGACYRDRRGVGDKNERAKGAGGSRSQDSEEADIPYTLFTSFFKNKFERLEEKLETSLRVQESRNRCDDADEVVPFKYKGNRIQFKFNRGLLGKLAAAKRETNDGDADKCAERLDELTKDVELRNKHIRIADASPGGWDTVEVYAGKNEVADNEEDARSIRKAEADVLRRRNQEKWKPSAKPFRNASPYQPAPVEEGRPNWRRGDQDSTYGRRPYQRPSTSSREGQDWTSERRSQGACFLCGSRRHWRRDCPHREEAEANRSRR